MSSARKRLTIVHGNAAPPEGQERRDAARGFEKTVLERFVALNAERTRPQRQRLPTILDTLAAIGRIRVDAGRYIASEYRMHQNVQ